MLDARAMPRHAKGGRMSYGSGVDAAIFGPG